MARAGQRDRAKERFWRKILRLWRHRGTATSVREFCAAYGVAESSFYCWRQHLAQCDRQRQRAAADRAAAKQPLFVPLTVTTPAAANPPAALELVLDSGRIVRVPPGFDAATLRQLLAVLEEGPSC